MPGLIYILSHDAMPSLLKIGYTNRSIDERTRELSSTGVPGKFTVELYFEAENAPLFELLLHKSLNEYRFEKEFFQIDMKTAIEAIHTLIGESKLSSYQFHGKSSRLATTKEQILEALKRDQEKSSALKLRAEKFREKYLNSTIDELKVERYRLYSSPDNWPYECKEIDKIINLKRDEVRRKNELIRKRNLFIFEREIKDDFLYLGSEVIALIKRLSTKKMLAFFTGYSYIDGLNTSKKFNTQEKILVSTFYKITLEIEGMDIEGFAYGMLLFPDDLKDILISRNSYGPSEYFKGILSGS